jgi:hypothetical protein
MAYAVRAFGGAETEATGPRTAPQDDRDPGSERGEQDNCQQATDHRGRRQHEQHYGHSLS